ncbi:DUF4998 domain-containing protein [Pararcticibacter amylolyticus]|uniref:Fibronectin type-III domain-containing protein n=1 Tax=Pararcticibacter amylolyticus TaxID=2173175 RepID=A0A2U2PGR3_9SPHI|nr:DUF4998 domain-containing protein [Pararcticibacter amylolyticus]PWG80550.1 hypothetical protein DDR33_10960 [Pararcticibacter amylolyticus]
MKNIRYIFSSLLVIVFLYSCEKSDTAFRDFFNGYEITYPGAVENVISTPGNLRVELKWKGSPDPSITKYVIYWNNRADSQVVNLSAKTDSIKATIGNLSEYAYSFTIYAVDGKGNHSIPKEINNIKVYGPLFQRSLLNRKYDVNRSYYLDNDAELALNFLPADTMNVTQVWTVIKYTNKQGVLVEKKFPGQQKVALSDYKPETAIKYRSAYIPGKASIDTFYVEEYADFPSIDMNKVLYGEADKSFFKAMPLVSQVTADWGTQFEKLWDGSVGPQSFPNLFHTNDVPMPHYFTFDLGVVYQNLARMEETGRDCCHNPVQFEIWGIADISNAQTTLAGNHPGWKDEMLSKGWTLLADVSRNDDGSAPYRFDLVANPPAVRYIRMRVKRTANGNTNACNISELTLWNKLK